MTSVELPKLDDVRGGFNLQSTANVSCTAFNSLKGGVVKGDDFTCEGDKERAESKTSGLGTTGGKDGKNNKESAASTIGASMLVTVLACAVGVFAL